MDGWMIDKMGTHKVWLFHYDSDKKKQSSFTKQKYFTFKVLKLSYEDI